MAGGMAKTILWVVLRAEYIGLTKNNGKEQGEGPYERSAEA
jgi:hypothetical protein